MNKEQQKPENSDLRLTRRDFLGKIAPAGLGILVLACEAQKQPRLTKGETLHTDRIEITNGGHKFYIGRDVHSILKDEIIDQVKLAHDWFLSRKIPVPPSITVFGFNDASTVVEQYLQRAPIPPEQREKERQNLRNATSWAGFSRDIYIVASSPGWTHASPIIEGPIVEGRLHIIAHETFHLFQREVGAYNQPPAAWMNEGSAHYAAAVMLTEKEKYNYQKIRSGHVGEALKIKEELNELESHDKFRNAGTPFADEFSLAFLAVEFAVRGLPNRGIDKLVNFWEKIGQGLEFPDAFEQVFGEKLAQFYTKFELYRKTGFKTTP